MSDISDIMDFSPTRQSKVAACEKLRDTVHSISAMHSSISEGASTPTKNSFLELYQMTWNDLAKKRRIGKYIATAVLAVPMIQDPQATVLPICVITVANMVLISEISP
ncbi:hypothetical protein TNCV_2158081 [Trichonephila clavipes]|nr:hypothetical protein TNCV_2158081 [Trichonephila clavipes]